jgi:signal transduction histidine kinase
MARRNGPRTSIRVRLTLLYGGMFFLAGALLILAGYLFVRHALAEGADALNNSSLFNLAHKVLPDKPVLSDGSGQLMTVDEFRARLVAEQQQVQDAALRTLLAQCLGAAGIVGVLALGAGWLMAGRVLRPLHRITATARSVADRSLGERIRLTGPPDELKELADTFDAMLERLDRAFDGQRRFVANASHELRTPLTVSRTLIQVALGRPDCPPELRRLGTDLLAVNTQQEELTDGLLALARSEHLHADDTAHNALDLADIAREAVAGCGAEGATRRIRLAAEYRAAPTVGDRVLLGLVVRNLVLNAVRHNHEHGWVRVRTGGADGAAQLTVDNTGPVVPDEEIEEIFQPFHRLGASRTGAGAGLGLSIVRSVVHAHGGRVSARPRAGGGLTVRVRLPGQAGASATSATVIPARRTTPPPSTSTAG